MAGARPIAVRDQVSVSRRTIIWLAAVFLALHNLEEALTFERFLARVPELLPIGLAALAPRLDYPTLLAALVAVTLLGVVVAALAAWETTASWGVWLLLVLEAAMAINAVGHLVTAAALFHGYAPGVVTAMLVNAPFAWYCFRRASRERWVSPRALRLTVPAALMLHGPVLLGGFWLAGRTR
jgi:hypothetical protein